SWADCRAGAPRKGATPSRRASVSTISTPRSASWRASPCMPRNSTITRNGPTSITASTWCWRPIRPAASPTWTRAWRASWTRPPPAWAAPRPETASAAHVVDAHGLLALRGIQHLDAHRARGEVFRHLGRALGHLVAAQRDVDGIELDGAGPAIAVDALHGQVQRALEGRRVGLVAHQQHLVVELARIARERTRTHADVGAARVGRDGVLEHLEFLRQFLDAGARLRQVGRELRIGSLVGV